MGDIKLHILPPKNGRRSNSSGKLKKFTIMTPLQVLSLNKPYWRKVVFYQPAFKAPSTNGSTVLCAKQFQGR